MKSILYRMVVGLFLFSLFTVRGDVPHYRGKIVLIVDQSILSDSQVNSRVTRLIDDLVGDGWRVLRHDIARGPNTPYAQAKPVNDAWAQVNAPLVRAVRALIKADYVSAPTEVKAVWRLGHSPIPAPD